MAIDYAALKSELNNDPGGLGYSTNIGLGNDQGVANTINLPRSGSAADGKSYSLFRNNIQPKEVVQALGLTDFLGMTSLTLQRVGFLFTGGIVDATISGVRANFGATFSGFTAGTLTALQAVSSYNGSRAEVLFGNGTLVTAADVSQALRHT